MKYLALIVSVLANAACADTSCIPSGFGTVEIEDGPAPYQIDLRVTFGQPEGCVYDHRWEDGICEWHSHVVFTGEDDGVIGNGYRTCAGVKTGLFYTQNMRVVK